MNEIHVDDIGTVFTITIKDGADAVDISTATTKNIVFKQPDKTLVTQSGSFVTDGTDGKIQYTTVSGDLADAGNWSLQAEIVITSGEWSSDIYGFEVHKNL